MQSTLLLFLAVVAVITVQTTFAFCPALGPSIISTASTSTSPSSTTSLFAVSALVRKAKEAELRNYIQEHGISDDIKEHYAVIQKAALKEDGISRDETMGKLQERLHRRKGTLTVIAEFKRKLSDSGFISNPEEFVPELLSNEFREFGAQGIAVLADERMGGCSYQDLSMFVEDQRRSSQEVPGPVPVINSDVVVDELQIARTKATGADAILLSMDVLGLEDLQKMLAASYALDLEVIVAVSTQEQAQQAIAAGARMISVVNVSGADEKTSVIQDLNIPEGATVTTIANILHRSDKGLGEVEEAWECRDKGFNCAWISDALYKTGNASTEHPGAIIKSMAAKSSVRWASPVAKSGRGEGAREYLGDILM